MRGDPAQLGLPELLRVVDAVAVRVAAVELEGREAVHHDTVAARDRDRVGIDDLARVAGEPRLIVRSGAAALENDVGRIDRLLT